MGIAGVMREKESLVIEWLDSIREQQNMSYGLLCFSDTPKEPVLWSHYADKHQGVVFEVKFDFDPEHVTKIHYPSERPTIDAKMYVKLRHNQAEFTKYLLSLINLLIRQKSPGWAYEREYRVFFDLQNNKGLEISGEHYFKRIPDNFLIRVILGWRCPLEESSVVKALAASGLPSTKVVRAKMSLDTYAVEC
jgi:hypothetical protein